MEQIETALWLELLRKQHNLELLKYSRLCAIFRGVNLVHWWGKAVTVVQVRNYAQTIR